MEPTRECQPVLSDFLSAGLLSSEENKSLQKNRRKQPSGRVTDPWVRLSDSIGAAEDGGAGGPCQALLSERPTRLSRGAAI